MSRYSPPLTDCIERGRRWREEQDRLELECRREGRYCVADAQLGAIRTRARVPANTTEAERLATIITLDRLLEAADEHGAKLLPMPVEAGVKLVRQLVHLKYRSMTGDLEAMKNAKVALQLARNSPLRSVRAVAAGLSEYLGLEDDGRRSVVEMVRERVIDDE